MSIYALDFPLGRSVVPAAAARRWRLLPPDARPLVGPGDQVRPDQPLAEMPNGSPPVLAGLNGWVLEVAPRRGVLLEGPATVVTGLLGLGNTIVGPLGFLARGESLAVVPIPRGEIIVYPQRLTLTLLQRAASGGAAGIVAASVSALELEAFARTDLTAVLDGLIPGIERFPLPVMLTEGVGDQPMDPGVLQLLTRHTGQMALLSGITDLRRNVRPELLLSLPTGTDTARLPTDSAMVVGALVRVVGGARRGMRGQVIHVFAHRQVSQSGQLEPSAQVRLEDGATHVIPLAALDRIG